MRAMEVLRGRVGLKLGLVGQGLAVDTQVGGRFAHGPSGRKPMSDLALFQWALEYARHTLE